MSLNDAPDGEIQLEEAPPATPHVPEDSTSLFVPQADEVECLDDGSEYFALYLSTMLTWDTANKRRRDDQDDEEITSKLGMSHSKQRLTFDAGSKRIKPDQDDDAASADSHGKYD